MSFVGGPKRKRRLSMRRKRTLDPNIDINYKNVDVLKRFVTDRGKIIPRRISGATANQQRLITLSVKRARFLSLLPFAVNHKIERSVAGLEASLAPIGYGNAEPADKPAQSQSAAGDSSNDE